MTSVCNYKYNKNIKPLKILEKNNCILLCLKNLATLFNGWDVTNIVLKKKML